MRYAFGTVIILAILAGAGLLIYHDLQLGPPVVLPAPTRLAVSAGQQSILPDGWTGSSTLQLIAAQSAGVTAGMDVEVRPAQQAFTGAPTATGPAQPVRVACAGAAACAGSGRQPAVAVHLADGHYRWQARLHDDLGVSPWKVYPGVISVDATPPSAPRVSSPTDPNPHQLYHSSTMRFDWHSGDAGSGVTGYSYRLDVDPHGTPRDVLRTSQETVTLGGLKTGTYYFHVRALDRAGNWGAVSTFPVRIDVTGPSLAHVRFNLYQFDPKYDQLAVSFAVTRPARSVRVGVYRQSDGHLIRLYRLSDVLRGQSLTVRWDGKNSQGIPVAAGQYMVYVRAIDRYGNSSLSGWRDFVVDYRRIVVSLSQQKLWAYDGDRLLLTSLVTTGNRALPTPTGVFHVLGKFHPFTFISPWPKSSPYYYKPSKVQYALLFREGGYFVHDAPWRTAFGPGTNAQLGTPGTNYTGTHGCVNTPPDIAQRLYDWAQIGTVVQVEA